MVPVVARGVIGIVAALLLSGCVALERGRTRLLVGADAEALARLEARQELLTGRLVTLEEAARECHRQIGDLRRELETVQGDLARVRRQP